MEILFTRCNDIRSKFLRWAFDEPVSHVGIKFFHNTDYQMVVDMTGDGFSITKSNKWEKDNTTVAYACLDLPNSMESEVFSKLLLESVKRNYDYATLGFGVMNAIRKRLGLNYNTKNTWDNREKLVCVEILGVLSQLLVKVGIDMTDIDFSSKTPWQSFYEITQVKNSIGDYAFITSIHN